MRAHSSLGALALACLAGCANVASPVNTWVGLLPLAAVPNQPADTGLLLNDRLVLAAASGSSGAPTQGGFTGAAQGYDPRVGCNLALSYTGTWSAQTPTVTLTYGMGTFTRSRCAQASNNGSAMVTLPAATVTLGQETLALAAGNSTSVYTRQP